MDQFSHEIRDDMHKIGEQMLPLKVITNINDVLCIQIWNYYKPLFSWWQQRKSWMQEIRFIKQWIFLLDGEMHLDMKLMQEKKKNKEKREIQERRKISKREMVAAESLDSQQKYFWKLWSSTKYSLQVMPKKI